MFKKMKSSIRRLASALALLMAIGILISFCGCQGGGGYDADKRSPVDPGEQEIAIKDYDTYFNYIELYDDKGGIYQVGDPFVYRWDGMYYLFSSATTGHLYVGVPCWKSENLVDWTFCSWVLGDGETEEPNSIWQTAFAPEIIYYNGYFYMCEAPGGRGHYIFRSETIDGKYECVSQNIGLGIDGSFYIYENELYLLTVSATVKELCWHKLSVTDEEVIAVDTENPFGISMFGWTEGPGYFNRNGYTYFTYTGNDVNTSAYRVGYSYTTSDNLWTDLQTRKSNLILLSTGDVMDYEGGGYGSNANYASVSSYRGLGHSSNVIGPNLDSVYTAYHNAGRYDHKNDGSTYSSFNRRANITQYYTNNSYVLTNSYCTFDAPKPEGSDFKTYGAAELVSESGFAVTEERTGDVYTAELNFVGTDNVGKVAVGVNGSDRVEIAYTGTELKATRYRGGASEVLGSAEVLASARTDAVHTVRVVNGYAMSEIYFDGVLRMRLDTTLGGGRIGYAQGVTPMSTQFTRDAFGTSDFESVKNLTGSFPAYAYLKGENRGFSIKSANVEKDGVRQGEKESTVRNEEYTALLLESGDWVKYLINAPEEGWYALHATVRSASAGTIFEAIVDGKAIYKMTIPESGFEDADYAEMFAGYFAVSSAGVHTLKIRVYKGTLDVINFATEGDAESFGEIDQSLTTQESASSVFKNIYGSYAVSEQDGIVTMQSQPRVTLYGGNKGICDYVLECDVKLNSYFIGGLLFRCRNFAYNISADAGMLFPDAASMDGYLLTFAGSAVRIVKYGWHLGATKTLATARTTVFAGDEAVHVVLTVKNNRFTVSVNGEEILSAVETEAYLTGHWGIFTDKTYMSVKNLKYREI